MAQVYRQCPTTSQLLCRWDPILRAMKYSSESPVNSPYVFPTARVFRAGGIRSIGGLPGAATVGTHIFPHHAAPLASLHTLPSILYCGRMLARGKLLTPLAIRRSHHSYFIHVLFTLHIRILLACSKSVIIKIWEKKYKKI